MLAFSQWSMAEGVACGAFLSCDSWQDYSECVVADTVSEFATKTVVVTVSVAAAVIVTVSVSGHLQLSAFGKSA